MASLLNDLWHWDITIVVADATAAAERLQQAGVSFISSGPVEPTESMFDFRYGFLVRDPDGHAIRIICLFPYNRHDCRTRTPTKQCLEILGTLS